MVVVVAAVSSSCVEMVISESGFVGTERVRATVTPRPSVCLSVCLSVRLSVCPSVDLCVCLRLPVWQERGRWGREGGREAGRKGVRAA